jgi:hypothetical protein
VKRCEKKDRAAALPERTVNKEMGLQIESHIMHDLLIYR